MIFHYVFTTHTNKTNRIFMKLVKEPYLVIPVIIFILSCKGVFFPAADEIAIELERLRGKKCFHPDILQHF